MLQTNQLQAFELADLLAKSGETGRAYLEFLKVPALSLGLYRLVAGASDPQQPHTEDEVYYVLAGHGSVRVGEERRPVETGSFIYVPARADHRFYDISEDLTLLVIFAPAEYSQSGEPTA